MYFISERYADENPMAFAQATILDECYLTARRAASELDKNAADNDADVIMEIDEDMDDEEEDNDDPE